jgi:gamma-glutamylcyclotransferase (GGCT)/AIG2-like uncharacterized protein YtfP
MLYFAYGSNLDETQMKERCPDSELVNKGYLDGYRLDFTKYAERWNGGVADVIPSEHDRVWGLIYRVTESDLALLDGFEGYPHVYDRTMISINTPEGILNKVWTYFVVEKNDFIPPSILYLNKIISAAVKHNFPEYYQETLKNIKTAEV